MLLLATACVGRARFVFFFIFFCVCKFGDSEGPKGSSHTTGAGMMKLRGVPKHPSIREGSVNWSWRGRDIHTPRGGLRVDFLSPATARYKQHYQDRYTDVGWRWLAGRVLAVVVVVVRHQRE